MPSHTRRPRFSVRAALAAAAFALFALAASPAPARAQSSQSARDARRIDMQMRQRALWDLEKLKNKPEPKAPDTRPVYRDVEEDFEQLQLVNHSLSGAAVQEAPLDYARIKRDAAEVRKRASRLKGYLSLPEPGEEGKANKSVATPTPEGLRSALASLDSLVKSFVWNPVFRRPDVVDLEQSSKASRDLTGIISLSEQIRRCAEEMVKGGKGAGKK